MYHLSLILIALLVSPAFAATGLQKTLGPCEESYSTEIEQLKKDYVKNSVWNYDNDFDLSDVAIKTFGFKKNSFKMNIFFDIKGLDDVSLLNYVVVTDTQNGVCKDVHISLSDDAVDYGTSTLFSSAKAYEVVLDGRVAEKLYNTLNQEPQLVASPDGGWLNKAGDRIVCGKNLKTSRYSCSLSVDAEGVK